MFRLIAAALVAFLPMAAFASTVTGFSTNTLVFGDSLSDPGNTPAGQFSNGDVWATQIGIGTDSGNNYAVGGARAWDDPNNPSGVSIFASQVDTFEATHPTPGTYDQAVIWFGANDLLNLSDPNGGQNAINEINLGIQTLAGYGIERFVIVGLPDLGITPLSLSQNGGNPNPVATAGAEAFNDGLVQLVGGLNAATSLDVRYVNTFALLNDVLDNDVFTNETEPCQGLASCEGYLFYDAIHPTEAAHAIVGDAIAAELAPIPLPPAAPLLGLGVIGLFALRRRAKMTVAV